MDQELANRLASLYEENFNRLYGTACRLMGSGDQAEEVVHDTFVLALARGEKFTAHPVPEAWLMMTLKNLCSNQCKRHSRTEASIDDIFHLSAPQEDRGLLELLPAALPEEDKQLLAWRYDDQMDYRMIADRLGISETACRSRVFRALERCRKLLL